MNIEHTNDVEKDEAQDGGPEGAKGATFVGKVTIITFETGEKSLPNYG